MTETSISGLLFCLLSFLYHSICARSRVTRVAGFWESLPPRSNRWKEPHGATTVAAVCSHAPRVRGLRRPRRPRSVRVGRRRAEERDQWICHGWQQSLSPEGHVRRIRRNRRQDPKEDDPGGVGEGEEQELHRSRHACDGCGYMI